MATVAVTPATNKLSLINIGLWSFQIIIASLMIMAGLPKLTGDPTKVELFQAIGLGQWFRYLTGSLELLGAIGLLIPKLSGYAAVLVALVMSGAVITHLTLLGGSPAIALALFLGSVLVALGRLWRK